jgi:dihydrofolate reductase
MGKMIYSVTTSLDGYVSDKNGDISWTAPSEEIHAFIDNILSNVGTFLLGRHMYETLAVWDTIPPDGSSEASNQFASIWRDANKIVYSTSLRDVSTANTTLEQVFSPEIVGKMVAESDKDFGIGGPHLAAEAMRAGLVDEYHQFIAPLMIGDGNAWLPMNVERRLKLSSLQKFDNGVVHLQYNKV